MRKLYTFLFAVLAACGLAQAQVTFDATVTLGSNTTASGADQVELNGVTIATTSGGLGTGQQYRFGKGSTTTITSTVGNITKIVFTCTAEGTTKYGPGCFDAQDGYSYEETVGTWTGSATEVTFVASSAQVRATTIAISIDGKDPEGGEQPGPQPQPQDEAKGTGTQADPFNYMAARTAALALEKGQTTDESYYIKGKISDIKYAFDAEHGTATFFLTDNGQKNDNQFQVYGTYYLGNRAWQEGDDQVQVGDEVIICGQLSNYNGTPETASKKNYIYSLNGKTDGGQTPEPQPGDQWQSSAEAPITVAKALELIATLDACAKSPVDVFVKGKIASITELSTDFGNATYAIVDEGADAELLIYRGYYLAGEKFTADDQIKVGDIVVVEGKLQNYVKNEVATPEVATGSKLYSINGKTDGGEQPGPGPDVTTYTKIADMQAAAHALGADKVAVKYTFEHAYVIGVKNRNIYITDGERGLLLYGDNTKNLKVGDVIKGTLAGELQLYNGVSELGNANYDAVEISDVTLWFETPKATIADVCNDATKLAYESMLVTIENLNIVVEDGTVKAIDDSDNEVVLYDQYGFGLADLEFLAGETYNVTAIVGSFKGEVQLYPRTKADIDGKFQEPEPFVAEGDGTFEKPYTVADVQGLSAQGTTVEEPVWVAGFIVGCANNNKIVPADAEQVATNIVLGATADEAEWANIIPVQLPNGDVRAALNILDNPGNVGKKVWVFGKLEKYFQVAGVKSVTDFSIDGLTTIIVPTESGVAAQTIFNLAGQRLQNITRGGVYVIGGRKVVVK